MLPKTRVLLRVPLRLRHSLQQEIKREMMSLQKESLSCHILARVILSSQARVRPPITWISHQKEIIKEELEEREQGKRRT